ncbi:MAG: response regulator transcription factor [Dysgonamonadaceae bacterium]|jgi:DNA-binding response OmpR family regulator|nr:response regulator transcription factor [Dysgonamonadaceae bacterium]
MNNLLVIEDDRRVADILKRGLEGAGFTVLSATDGEMGLKLFQSEKCDLVICDIMLPKIDGFGVCKEIRKTDSKIPILMLTALGEIDDKLVGFDSGANDYMVKPFDMRELEVRIKLLLKRQSVTDEQQADSLRYNDLEIDLRTQTVTRNGQEIKLTPREFNLLLYMLRNPQRILTRQEIAQKVWNTHFETGTNFIDVYINYLRKKIDRDFAVKLIHTKPGIGFIFQSKNED